VFLLGRITPASSNLEQFYQFHFSGKMCDDTCEHWEEDCPRLGEWNDHELLGKEEVHG
jgi:hypothetical protein